MEKRHLQQIEISNKNVPETLKAEILKVQNRIIEVENIVSWVISFPGDKDCTLSVLGKLNKIIAEAKKGVREVNNHYPEGNKPDTERSFLSHMKGYCTKLWDIRIKLDLYEQR